MNNSIIKQELVDVNLKFISIAVLSSLLIAASAQVTVSIGPVPVTLQTFSVIFLTLVLGRKLALTSLAMYIVEILCGLPVMANFHTLSLSLMNFGYILAFIPLVFILTNSANKDSQIKTFALACLSNLVIYIIGAGWLGMFIGFNQNLLLVGVIPFIIPDMIKAIVAIKLARMINQ